jgi:hypothetical protein
MQTCPAPNPCQFPTTHGAGIGGELYFNAGGIWPTRTDAFDNNKIKAQGIYGIKGGIFLGANAEIEGSFGYLTHFEPSNSPNPLNFNTSGGFGQPSILGFLYDINYAYNFGNRSLFGARFAPYIAAGIGGLTAEVKSANSAFMTGGGFVPLPDGTLVPNPTPARIISDGDSFFTANYGGGIKMMNLWGPVGFRVDARGRSVANFFGQTLFWPEVTGGLLLTFGER